MVWHLYMSETAVEGGPLVLYWPMLPSSPAHALPALGDAAVADILAAGGVIASAVASTQRGTVIGQHWYQDDLPFTDQLVACVLAQRPVSPRRIHLLGADAGGFYAAYMWQAAGTLQDPAHVPPVLAIHGGANTDYLLLDYGLTSLAWIDSARTAGGLAINCTDVGDHTLGAMTARRDAHRAFVWSFFRDHPYGATPYAALPQGWPGHCSL